MKKQILNLGKALNKAEQKQINGGYISECFSDNDCGLVPNMYCTERGFCRAICNGVQCPNTNICEVNSSGDEMCFPW